MEIVRQDAQGTAHQQLEAGFGPFEHITPIFSRLQGGNQFRRRRVVLGDVDAALSR